MYRQTALRCGDPAAEGRLLIGKEGNANSEERIAFVVKELGGSLSKVSMRSRTKDIAQVCSEFGGGGHKLAAGAVIKTGADDAVRRILDVIKEKGLC